MFAVMLVVVTSGPAEVSPIVPTTPPILWSPSLLVPPNTLNAPEKTLLVMLAGVSTALLVVVKSPTMPPAVRYFAETNTLTSLVVPVIESGVAPSFPYAAL